MEQQMEREMNERRPNRLPSSGQAGRKSAPIEMARNTMVQDEQDMKRLGNDMKAMKTNSQLLEDGWIPDPIQE